MSKATRRRIKVSGFRKNILEVMRLARGVPLVVADRCMHLAPLVEARRASTLRPSWTVIFSRAFALVAARHPELRTAYMSFPYPHLYEHPCSSAMVIIEREYRGEWVPLNVRLRKPELLSLQQLHETVEAHRTGPLERNGTFQFLRLLGWLPFPVRRLVWSLAHHWSGSKRARYFGTFGLSTPAASGAGLVTIQSPLTCTLHYGLFDEESRLDMRISFDHRAIDGAPVARALAEMEQVLLTEIIDEIRQLPRIRLAA